MGEKGSKCVENFKKIACVLFKTYVLFLIFYDQTNYNNGKTIVKMYLDKFVFTLNTANK